MGVTILLHGDSVTNDASQGANKTRLAPNIYTSCDDPSSLTFKTQLAPNLKYTLLMTDILNGKQSL